MKSVKSIEIYSNKTKSWQQQYIQVKEKFDYCVCSFMKELFILGGWNETNERNLNLCYKYNMKSDKWNQIADLNFERSAAACELFEGKIVVSGGLNYDDELKTVEAYDYYEDKCPFIHPYLI